MNDDWFDVLRALLQSDARFLITRADFDHPGPIIQFGLPPNRIDLLTAISGLPDFTAAWTGRCVHEVRGHPVPFLGRTELIVNKRAAEGSRRPRSGT